MSQRQRTVEIRQFITDMVGDNPRNISKLVCEHFGISRQAASNHLREMESSGALKSSGRTNNKTWSLQPRASFSFDLGIEDSLAEDVPWRENVKPNLEGLPENVLMIISYAFTEMLNNVIDHSGADTARVRCVYTAECVDIQLADNGIGIFQKLKTELKLSDEREAILQLAMGKVTTDPVNHTGEGIFFTSRMCDIFSMWSGRLFFTHVRPDSDWLIETDRDFVEGTHVRLVASLRSDLEIKDLFDRFTSSPDDLSFSRTHVPIKLANYDSDGLVSRSQARRVLSRFDKFNEVILDFAGVDFIGQAFADEIFRVFKNETPSVKVYAVNASPFVSAMIRRAKNAQ